MERRCKRAGFGAHGYEKGRKIHENTRGPKMIRCLRTLLTGSVSIWLVTSMPNVAAAENGVGASAPSVRGEIASLRLPKISRRDKLFAGCLERLHSSDKQIEYRTVSGGRVTLNMEGGRVTSASNGRHTATAVFKGVNATEVRLSDGRTFEVRKKMSAEERANLAEKFNRMNRHVARVLARECNLGISVGEAEGGLRRVSDGGDDYPGDWDSAYETEEFFELYWAQDFDLSQFWQMAAEPRRMCIVVENSCKAQCESSKDAGNLACTAIGGALALTFPVAGLLYGLSCATGVIYLTNACMAECAPSRVICD